MREKKESRVPGLVRFLRIKISGWVMPFSKPRNPEGGTCGGKVGNGREERIVNSISDMLVSDVSVHLSEGDQQAVGYSSQELGRKVWAADLDPKFITLWMQLKPWEKMGQPGEENRVHNGPLKSTSISG